uniref:Uncharacterized protein n=1 Tax=Meloidogyne enterolobii TaxID=390850 RepID=A0A6V7XHL9_MELEN|nr:unnamed protein product [Meloidogyne enterolobii]
MDYLCNIYGSPLYKYFVETNICSSISMEFIEQYHCEVIAKFYDVSSCKVSSYVSGSSSYYGKINEDDKLRLINKRVEEALAEYNSVENFDL